MKLFPDMGTGVTLGVRATALFPESERLSPKRNRSENPAEAADGVVRQRSAKNQPTSILFMGLPFLSPRPAAASSALPARPAAASRSLGPGTPAAPCPRDSAGKGQASSGSALFVDHQDRDSSHHALLPLTTQNVSARREA